MTAIESQIEQIKADRRGKPVRARFDIPAELLEVLYVERRLSTLEIARQLGTTKRTVRIRLIEHGIPVRGLHEAFAVSTTHPSKAPPMAEAASRWKGGRKMHTGYWMVMQKDHPEANADGYVFEHRLVAEQSIGRPLLPKEEVHHINEIRTDNRPENLQVMSKSAHMSLHTTARHAARQAERGTK